MENRIENSCTRTKDFYIATTMKTLGVPLLSVEQGVGDFSVFVFDIDPMGADELINKYWSHELLVDPNLLMTNIHELKARLAQRKSHV